jgi:hypothetical protein
VTAQGAAELDRFGARFEQEIGAWQVAIATALADDSS